MASLGGLGRLGNVGNIRIDKLDGSATLDVKIYLTKIFKLRLFVFRVLMTIACNILGCGFKIESKIIDEKKQWQDRLGS